MGVLGRDVSPYYGVYTPGVLEPHRGASIATLELHQGVPLPADP